ncbi:unnamed protein product [Kuraishia capsulata CBS 1993]|uniref:holo-[acyl-carrier-protein] synthase n=1 Tax=Kuraishia capsulata CBS 1993 TaxID=1382522 RepID=W6MHL9_9ASCO|nr:uncharacterized protein KUCA_T00001205001 [Kuraishia capsulata CBS 1993]CDK25238.1 unnamed protein product [Kuraishia capsulata CBS 1993]
MPSDLDGVYESFAKCVSGSGLVVFVVKFDPDSNLLLDDYNFEMFMRLQSLQKQLRIKNLKFRNLQILSLINASLVKFICSIKCGNMTNPQISTGEFGKPSLEDGSFTFNISDEFNMVAIAVDFEARGEIGLDLADLVEMRPLVPDVSKNWTAPTGEIFSPRETQYLLQQYESWHEEKQTNLETLLTQYWSLKEGYTKFIGLGLNYPLVKCEFLQSETILKRSEKLDFSPQDLHFKDLETKWVNSECICVPKTTSFSTRLSERIFCSVLVDASISYEPPKLISVSLEAMLAFCKSAQD